MGGPKIAAVASGATAVRYLSSEAGERVGESNESSRITPLHRYPMQGALPVAVPETAAAVGAPTARTQANRRSQVRLGFAISTVATAAFIGVYFHVEVAAFLTGYNFRELASQELRKPDSVALRPQAEVEQAKAQVATQDAAQITQAVETSALEAGQSLKNEQRSEASANEPAALMQEAKTAQAIAADAEPQRRALDEAQARAAALASELAGTRREIETQAAQSQKAVDAATKQKQAAESTIAELRESLQQRDRTEAMARDLATVRRTMDVRVTGGRSADSHVVHVTQAVKTAVTEPPKAAEAQGNAEAATLIARASALLGQGDIGAARIVLERASEMGSAKASFMLAETYDPAILTAWGTYGTRSEVTKARELYAKAHGGGIQEAKYRLNALHQ